MAQDYGWAYVAGAMVTGAAGTVGSIQFRGDGNSLGGSDQLVYDYANTALILSGNLSVSGSVSANQFNLDVTNKTVTNLTATGSTKFGDTSDDTHEVTGSILLKGMLSSSLAVSASIFYGSAAGLTDLDEAAIANYTNPSNNRIITSVDSDSVNAEENLTFDGSTLSVTGDIEASNQISGSSGLFTLLTASVGRFTQLTVGTGSVVITEDSIEGVNLLTTENIGGTLTTAAQPNITSLGSLTTLTVDSTTLVVNETTNRVGVGRSGPERALDVLDSANPQLRLTHTASPAKHVDFQSTSEGYLFLDPSGDRVGINTSSPTAELAVTGAAHISGNVGIFTKTPEEALDVHGNARITGNLYVSGTLSARVTDFQVSADTLTFGDESGDAITINASTVAVPNNLNFDSNTLFIDSSDNRVGVGTATPETTLHVQNGSAGTIAAVDNAVLILESNEKPRLQFQSPGAYGGTIVFGSPTDNDEGQIDYDHGSDRFLFKTGGGTKMAILGSNVGVGTSAPAAKLHVVGDAIATGGLFVSGSVTGSIFTNGTVTISGSTVSGVGTLTANTVTATNLGGTLSTAAQPNITSVGNLTGLTVDSTTFVVNGTTNKVGIGRASADKKLEIVDSTAAQLRITHTVSDAGGKYADLLANSTGDLVLQPSSDNVGIGTTKPNANLAVSGTLHVSASSLPMKIQGLALATTTTSSFLALDSNNNLILTSSGTVEYINAAIMNYNNPSDNRILTSVDSDSVNAEANFTFDGTTVALTGQLSSSIGLSSSLGQFTELTGSKAKFDHLTDGDISITGGQISNVSLLSTADISTINITSSHALFTNIKGTLETPAQANITSVGNLTALTVDSTTLVVKSATNRVGIGRSAPQRKLDVFDDSGVKQVRVSYDSNNFSELQTSPTGDFSLSASSGVVHVSGSLRIDGLSSGTATTGSYLALDSDNNVVLTSSSGIGAVTIANDADNRIVTAVGDGTINGEANLTFDGLRLLINSGLINKRTTVTGDYSVLLTDYFIGITPAAEITLTLPDASTLTSGQTFVFKDESGTADTNNIIIETQGGQLIDGETFITLESPFAAINLYTNGSNKYFIF